MRVPISWLKDFVEIDSPAELIAERLTLAGFEVGHLIYIGVPQQQVEGVRVPPSDHLVWDRDKLVLGAIREVKPHPDADRLVLAMVDYGGDELEQCVTGAPNLFDYLNKGELNPPLWTGFAKEGAEVWDGHSDEPRRMILKGRKLRGVYNKSMVLSEKELGISDEHEGIIIIEHDDSFVAGTPLQDVLGDVVLDVELTPNLGHGFSMWGVAREVAALMGKPLKDPSFDMVAEGEPIDGKAAIEITNPELNPRFTLTLLTDTEVRQSPWWIRHRLKLVGQRPINNIVDITNYITFEIGQPLHAFDYDKLVKRAGNKAPTIITRTPKKGEKLLTLDGVERALEANQILVTDTAGVLSLGGIIGGEETEIDDNTKNVLLEAASWNFINIRKTSQAQKVFTEAGTRFSRNIHPSRAILGNQRGIELMRQTGGGTIAQGIIDDYPAPPEAVQVELPIAEVERLLGVPSTAAEVASLLTSLQFEVTIDSNKLIVTVPDYRTDISTGIVGQADLVEEIARIQGYDTLPDTIMTDELPEQRGLAVFETEEHIRDLLVALGLTENISYRFTTPEAEAKLTPAGQKSSLPDADYVTVKNPIASDKTVLRHSLLTEMLQTAARNLRYNERQQVFEIGSVYLQGSALLPEEPSRLAILMTGPRRIEPWTHDENIDPVDFFDIKGVIESLLDRLHIADYGVAPADHTTYHPGRSAALVIGGDVVGHFGELHPLVAKNFKLTETPVMVAEFELDRIISAVPYRFELEALPVTPPILEDIALVVKNDITNADVEDVIRRAGGAILRDVRLFDVYEGDSIEAGHRSLAYALTYQAPDKTLKDKDVEKIRKKIITLAEKELGAKLRA